MTHDELKVFAAVCFGIAESPLEGDTLDESRKALWQYVAFKNPSFTTKNNAGRALATQLEPSAAYRIGVDLPTGGADK